MKTRSTPALVVFFFLLLCCPVSAGETGSPPRKDGAACFVNVASPTGIAGVPAQRVAFVDVDGDLFLDCLLINIWKKKATALYLNRAGDGGRVFENVTEKSGIARTIDGKGERNANLVIFADVDNDGDIDAFSGMFCDFLKPGFDGNRTLRSAILLNDGHGVFSVQRKSGVGGYPATTCAATFFDSDKDGRIDLFTGAWYKKYGTNLDSYQDRLYRGTGRGLFEDVTEARGLATVETAGKRGSARPVYGAGHCDYNNDGCQDILVCAYGRQWNVLWENDGGKRFTDAAEKTGFAGDAITHGRYSDRIKKLFLEKYNSERKDELPFRSNGNTFSVAAADFDNDGDIDLFLGEITHGWAGESSDLSCLLINGGKERGYLFDRDPGAIPRRQNTTDSWNRGDMHVAWIDFDNDGLLDLLISSGDYPDGQYLRLFRQRADHSFEDITALCGFEWESSSGISVGDFDRDGDIDILAGRSWMRMPADRRQGNFPAPALFRNDMGSRNNWITIQLRGRGKGGANALGIGARVTIEAGELTQMREIQGGCGHCGQFNPPEAHFGIGGAAQIDRITVRWPNRKGSTWTAEKIAPNRLVRISEGKGLEQLLP
jgi:enediyne biosynthesis protein E4